MTLAADLILAKPKPALSSLMSLSAVTGGTMIIVILLIGGCALFISFLDRRLSAQQQALDGERRLLRAVIDNIPDYIYAKDAQSRFVLANTDVARLMGRKTPDELLGKTDFDFFPEEWARAFYEDEQQVLRSGEPLLNREERAVDSAGNEVYGLTTKVPLRDSHGRITGIAGIGRDITARKKSEDALREAERKYRSIFNDAIVGIYQCTPAGRFLSVNPFMAKMFGYSSPEEMIASVTDISTQLYVDSRLRDAFRLLLGKLGRVQDFECEFFRKDGSKFWIAASVYAVCENGAVVRHDGMIVDVTERRFLREQLLQAQKLESVGQLAAGIAHEINTPIQYVGDNVRFLQDAFAHMRTLMKHFERILAAAKENNLSAVQIQEAVSATEHADIGYLIEEIPKAIEQSKEGVTRVSTLVRAMKEFSHPSTKCKVPLDLNHAIESTVTVARNEWKYVAEVETDFDQSLSPVPCLPGEFNQAILNLIVNAAHAIADVVGDGGLAKGKIRIQTRRCAEWVEIRIQDTGTGIPKSIQSRVFDPFFTTKQVGKGTGQGLSIAHSVFVDKHEGSIHFETKEGKGTTFVVRIPFEGKSLAASSGGWA
jgi:PAS domain S-box-containing protein